MAKVLLSMDDDLLRRIDRRAQALDMTRSGYLAELARGDLGGHTRRRSARRAIQQARLECAKHAHPDSDSTEIVRNMRDAR